jgi:hypothetical protein
MMIRRSVECRSRCKFRAEIPPSKKANDVFARKPRKETSPSLVKTGVVANIDAVDQVAS